MLSISRLKKRLSYHCKTGIFIWVNSLTNKKNGSIAGSKTTDGYIRIKVDGRLYLAHRLAWFYINSVWPIGEIDHINHIKHDNRICNLRDVSRSENQQNQNKATVKNVSTKLIGASFNKRLCKFVANISVNGKYKHLGVFGSAEDAHNAYIKAKRIYHSTCTI